ncbi:MAG TPA: MFS transporter [Candidatus Binatia bacterium]|nr:MFS transporter [Candidatus Binatia bacterium]
MRADATLSRAPAAPWLWDMTRYQWTVLAAAWLGWGFDVFDGLLFNFVAPVGLPSLLGVPRDDPRVGAAAGVVTAVLLVGWATGGIAFGWVADRIGRARTLLATMCTYAIATAACAVAPDVWTLGALRFVAALGIGGEWAAGASLVAEVVPAHRRVAAGALLYTSSPLAVFLAAAVNDVVTSWAVGLGASSDVAWRLVFLAGLVPAALAVWIRRGIREPAVWETGRGAPPRLGELFAPSLRRATLGGFGLCLVTLVTWWGTNAFLPFVAAFLAGPGADAATVAGTTTYATAAFNLGGLVGAVATIPLARLGRRPLFALYFAGAALSIAVTFALAWDPTTRMRLLFLDGLTVFGVNASYCFYLPELFPTRLRATGAGFCFNTGRYAAALGPFLVGHALGAAPTPMAAIRWVAVVPLLGLALVPFVVETAGRGRADPLAH